MRLFLQVISAIHCQRILLGGTFILDIIYPMVANIDFKHQYANTALGRYLENTEVVRPGGYVSVSHTCTILPREKFKLQWSSVSFHCPLWVSQVFLRSWLCCMWVSTDNWSKDIHDYLLLISLMRWFSDMLSSSTLVICLILKGNSKPLGRCWRSHTLLEMVQESPWQRTETVFKISTYNCLAMVVNNLIIGWITIPDQIK